MPIQKAFLATWHAYRASYPTLPHAGIVVGLSGGADSLTLLHLLSQQKHHPLSHMTAVYVDHGIHTETHADRTYLEGLTREWGIRFVVKEVDVPALVQQHHLSLEEAARTLRYQALREAAEAVGADFVAVAHHADDQAETILMHLIRGSGLAGLRGMLPIVLMPHAPHLTLLRPLLSVRRAEIEAYCRQYDLAPRTDPTNADVTFFRNRLRHKLLPQLVDCNPQIVTQLYQLGLVVAEDDALLDKLSQQHFQQVCRSATHDWLKLDLDAWRALPVSLQRRVLRQAVLQLAPDLRDVGFRSLEQARQLALQGTVGQQAILPAQLTLTVGYQTLTVTTSDVLMPTATLPQLFLGESTTLPLPGQVTLDEKWVLSAQLVPEPKQMVIRANLNHYRAYVALPLAIKRLQVRTRLPGERYQPLGMGGRSAKIQDVMVNRKVPALMREYWPLVSHKEHVVWLVGHQIDERVKVTPDMSHCQVWLLQCKQLG